MKILFGVFDWGLGHATRDLPIIEALLQKGHTVHIITTGRALTLLKNRLQKRCTYFDVPSITPPYAKSKFMAIKFARMIPQMLLEMNKAHKVIKKIIKENQYDKVISDCRYDVYDTNKNSYLINHQVRFQAPPGAELIIERWLASRIKRYDKCLIPDFEEPNLSGRLSHHLKFVKKEQLEYIGILSQVKKKNLKEDIDCFISISGPEPQRTILERKIFKELPLLKGKIVITLGKPELNEVEQEGNVTIYGFLNTQQQETMMNRAKCVVSRSGYTTIMELVELGKKNILFIPTPGQTEQEYLGRYYTKKGYFYAVAQNKLHLQRDLIAATHALGFQAQWTTKESVKKCLKVIGV